MDQSKYLFLLAIGIPSPLDLQLAVRPLSLNLFYSLFCPPGQVRTDLVVRRLAPPDAAAQRRQTREYCPSLPGRVFSRTPVMRRLDPPREHQTSASAVFVVLAAMFMFKTLQFVEKPCVEAGKRCRSAAQDDVGSQPGPQLGLLNQAKSSDDGSA